MSQRQLCYLDNNATTRIAPEVLEAMLPFFQHQWGNPSIAYTFGKRVANHIEKAREKLAAVAPAIIPRGDGRHAHPDSFSACDDATRCAQ